jgi:hypothetical protein
MTQPYAVTGRGLPRRRQADARSAAALTLRQSAPAEWRRDLPAYAGDPYMDWESRPEPPNEPRMILTEAKPRTHWH